MSVGSIHHKVTIVGCAPLTGIIGVQSPIPEASRCDRSICGIQAYQHGEQFRKRGCHARHNMAKSQTGRPAVRDRCAGVRNPCETYRPQYSEAPGTDVRNQFSVVHAEWPRSWMRESRVLRTTVRRATLVCTFRYGARCEEWRR